MHVEQATHELGSGHRVGEDPIAAGTFQGYFTLMENGQKMDMTDSAWIRVQDAGLVSAVSEK